MTLLTMTVPDDPAELPGWLERRMMAPDFGRFIAELSAHFPPTSKADQPLHLIDRWLPMALEGGLAPIPPEVLSELLRYPPVLAAFQERVVTDGGAYWDDLPDASGDLSGRLERGKLALDQILQANAPASSDRAVPQAVPEGSPARAVQRAGGRGYKSWAIISTGIAACLAAAVAWLAISKPAEPPVLKSRIAWGWAKPDGLATDQSKPKDYLNKLAANAEEWSIYRPADANGVGQRIAELRLGCTLLMHSTYGPLTPPDKAWLLEHCRAWAKMLDGHQQALDAGADPMTVRAGVDETVRIMTTTLRDKAKQIG